MDTTDRAADDDGRDDFVPAFAQGFYEFEIVAEDGSQVKHDWARSGGKAALQWNLDKWAAESGHVARIVGFRPI